MSRLVLDKDHHRLCVDREGKKVLKGNCVLMYDSIGGALLNVPFTKDVLQFCQNLQSVVLEEDFQNSITRTFEEESTPMTYSTQPGLANSVTQPSAFVPHEEIWMKYSGKPTPRDLQATDKLIEIVCSDRFQLLLKDKTSRKKNVWSEIGNAMVLAGFSFGTRDPGAVCHQKWRNMEGKTVEFIQKGGPNNTGGGKVNKPSYYEDVHAVIKDSAKAFPKNLLDSMPVDEKHTTPSTSGFTSAGKSNDQKTSEAGSEDEDDPKAKPDSPFLKVSPSTKPKRKKTNNAAVLEFLKADAAERKKAEDDVRQLYEKKLKQDQENHEKLINVLSKFLEK